MKKIVFIILILGFLAVLGSASFLLKERVVQEPSCGCVEEEELLVEINFFFSETCSVCATTDVFLDKLKENHPRIKINKCAISKQGVVEELVGLYEEYNVDKKDFGAVPAVFIQDKYFIGFSQKYAKEIENYVVALENGNSTSTDASVGIEVGEGGNLISLPILGEIDASKYSFPVLALVLGFFDGFNVCSLGALVLILGLVIVLKSRKKMLVFGGIFILTTSIIYGLLILFWYHLFVKLAGYLKIMEVLIGLLGIAGGIYFLKEFVRFRRQGLVCETKTDKGVIAKLSSKMQEAIQGKKNILIIVLTILLFAAIITIVEFPCSAAVPLFFAGTLAEAELSVFQYFICIALFVFSYMIDEIVIFLLAVFTMTIKLASKKFVVWITFIEAIVLFLLGAYYLFGFLIFH